MTARRPVYCPLLTTTIYPEITLKKSLLTAACCLALVNGAWAQVAVKQGWVRATVPQQTATGAFLQLTASQDARLVQASSPVAAAVELHEMTMNGSTMQMRAVAGVDLPAGKTVEFKPGGLHVMLMGLKSQVKAGDKVPLTLVFEGKDKKRENVLVQLEAHQMGAMPGAMH